MKKINLILFSLMVMTIGLTSCEEPETLSANENMELIGTWERTQPSVDQFSAITFYIDNTGLVDDGTPMKWVVEDNVLTINRYSNGVDKPVTSTYQFTIESVTDNTLTIIYFVGKTVNVYSKLK